MLEMFQGQVAVVSGGASGLGAATVVALAQAGLTPAILDLDLERGTAHAKAHGGICAQADVSDPESVRAALAQIVSEVGVPRVLVNCAGIAPGHKTVSRGEPHPFDAFDKTIRINLIGSFNCATQVAALMAETKPLGPDTQRGVIIHTASIAAYEGQVGQIAYSASKGGVVGMTLPMARDLADKGIRVCSIAPGLFLTPLLEGLPPEVQTSLGAQVPNPPRLGRPEEFGKLVLHILDNPMMNGETIRMDGALRLQPK